MTDLTNFIQTENKHSEVHLKDEFLGSISDDDFGFEKSPAKAAENSLRYCVRCILTNDKDEICVIKSEKYGYQQIPGGRVDPGESIITALKREAHEEAGCTIKNIRSLGYFIEHKYAPCNEWDAEWISFVFAAQVDQDIGTQFEDYEQEAGFAPVWLPLSEAVSQQAAAEQSYQNSSSNNSSYNGRFACRRDYLLLQKYQELLHNKA